MICMQSKGANLWRDGSRFLTTATAVCQQLESFAFPRSWPIGTLPSTCLCGDLDVKHVRRTARKSGRLHTCLARTWLWLTPPEETEEGRGPGAWLDSLRRFATVHTSRPLYRRYFDGD